MAKSPVQGQAPTMIIPRGTQIEVDVHGQLNISTPGNLVIENSGHFGILESLHGSIRIESDAEVEAVKVQCASVCYIEGSLTAWKVAAQAIHLEDRARANIVLQETEELEIGREARLVGNFSSEKELFLLFSRFADQIRSLPLFAARRDARPIEIPDGEDRPEDMQGGDLFEQVAGTSTEGVSDRTGGRPGQTGGELPDPLFFALILLEREFARSAYGPTSQRVVEELIKLLQERDLETLRLTYKTLFGRIVEPGGDVLRAFELIHGHSRDGLVRDR
jgi:hypothetical protein